MAFKRLAFFVASCAAVAVAPNAVEERGMHECQSALVEMNLDNMPTMSPELIDMVLEQSDTFTMTDPCVVPAVTGSLAPDYTSYIVAAASWNYEHYGPMSNMLSACSELPAAQSMQDIFDTMPTPCAEMTFQVDLDLQQEDTEDQVELRRLAK